MISTVIQELPTVIFEHRGTLPEEDNDTNILLSYIALNIALVDKPLRISEKYHQVSRGQFIGTLEVVYRADHELKWDQIQARLLLIYRRTQAIEWYPVRYSTDYDLDCKIQEITIDVNPSIDLDDTETAANAGTNLKAVYTESEAQIAGIEAIAAYQGQPRFRAFDQHFNYWRTENYMPDTRNEVLPSAEDGGPGLEPIPGSLPASYEVYLSLYQERVREPLLTSSDDDDDDNAPHEVALRIRSFHWHCCAWAHYKLGQLSESMMCFAKAVATPFNRFRDLQRESKCPVPGIAPYPDQEYLLWQVKQQLPGWYAWRDGNLERHYWLSMALTAISSEKIPDLARLYSDYLGLMLQGQYYFVANQKTQAFATLIKDCEAAQRRAPAEHAELYWMLNNELQVARAGHMNEHPTATEAEQDAIQRLYGEFSAKQTLEDYRRHIQYYVGS